MQHVRVVTAGAALALAALITPAGAAAADEIIPNRVELIDPSTREPVHGGGSDTDFWFDLPRGSSCPGDSANDDYRVQSYMVPATDEPVQLLFDGLGPVPYSTDTYAAFRQPLYDTAGEPYDVGFTAENERPGEPGLLLDTPPFDFTAYPAGALPPGRYRIGLTCTHGTDVHSLWETEIQIDHDAADAPAGLRWTVTRERPSDDGTPDPALLLAGGAGAAAIVVLIRRRTSSRPTPTGS